MSSATQAHTQEQTFSTYNAAQGASYAEARLDYSALLYNTVLSHHDSTDGKRDLVLDVGTGPGNASRSLASNFSNAIALDPAQGMIDTARTLGGESGSGKPIRFEVGSAEDLGLSLKPAVEAGSVDLITAANAAHWFNMPAFWAAASRVLKPGGTVALWASGRPKLHPGNPNAAAIQDAVERHDQTYLTPYKITGNLLAKGGYTDLVLPWTVPSPSPDQKELLEAFDSGTFYRKDWTIDEEFNGVGEIDLDRLERIIRTGSPQTRYDEAHPEDVGTARDPVKILRKEVERLLHEAGMTTPDKKLKVGGHGVLLMVKKRQSS